MRTYSFKDGQGTINLPNIATGIDIGGSTPGIGRIGFNMADNISEIDVSADGGVMVSAQAAPNGTVVVEVQQTSSVHKALLAWANYLVAAFNQGDISDWTAAYIYWYNAVDETSHSATGICPQKVPDKMYEKRGQNVVWTLIAASVVSE